MKQAFWRRDWFAGFVICIVIISLGKTGLFDHLERTAYDLGVRSSERTPNNKIAIIAVDDISIANIGRWPWPRGVHAKLHRILKKGGAKVIGQTIFFIDPQNDPGMRHIQELLNFYSESSLHQGTDKNDRHNTDVRKLGIMLLQAENDLNADQKLADSLRDTGNVVLAMHMGAGKPRGKPDRALPDYVTRNQLKNVKNNPTVNPGNEMPLAIVDVLYPIKIVGEVAQSIGALTISPDTDGSIRSEPLVVDYYNQMYPSMSLQLALKSLNLKLSDVTINLGDNIQLKNLSIKTNKNLLMNTFFYNDKKGSSAFDIDSFYDVLQGKIPASKYKGKIVLIGATAVGVGDTMVTPINANMAPVLTLAHSVSSILNEDFFIRPSWSLPAIIGITAFIAFYIIFLLPRMNAALSATLTILMLAGLFAAHYFLMTRSGLWLQLVTPSILLIAGHLLLTTKRYLSTEKGNVALHAESAESNRMLGLSLQGQGQLDAAFDKFRRLPRSAEMLELLYNLALDFERKRQFNKAGSVYQFMKEIDPKFRDIKQRISRASAMEETVILGVSPKSSSAALALGKEGVEKPMLGRYEVDKELGKGAMGAVYLGKDPKISRIVAIKTMALSQEFEEDELQNVKARFFREAETAGRLSHPNIVTIYDAGEEHDLAYIAMEFLQGHDMVRYGKPENLLPVPRVLDIIRRVAEGLDYAHKQNVVHRDIKPANIMFEPKSNTLKITDFGIARITDSSKTKTGMVLGTPSYMSPEQLAGKKVNGRSDLFSLGVMMFQLVTGKLPFQGDSMAALMFKIANEVHPQADSIRTGLPRCVCVIINRALTKKQEKRYQTGAQMAGDLRKCMQIIAQKKQAVRPETSGQK
ncbi:Protein kinase [hydrothermal vent metagenome]|uniref:Protein kinase n=1 Tax=hydrothermal vent metagenome TaxID=652676 RepID=A0A3B0XLU7_9ZZZZ